MASESAPQPQNPVAAQPASTGLGDVLADKLDRLVIKHKEKHLPHASHALRDNG